MIAPNDLTIYDSRHLYHPICPKLELERHWSLLPDSHYHHHQPAIVINVIIKTVVIINVVNILIWTTLTCWFQISCPRPTIILYICYNQNHQPNLIAIISVVNILISTTPIFWCQRSCPSARSLSIIGSLCRSSQHHSNRETGIAIY